jgi:hypothetical protein
MWLTGRFRLMIAVARSIPRVTAITGVGQQVEEVRMQPVQAVVQQSLWHSSWYTYPPLQ